MSKRSLPNPFIESTSDTPPSTKSPTLTPTSTFSDTPPRSISKSRAASRQNTSSMEGTKLDKPTDDVETSPAQPSTSTADAALQDAVKTIAAKSGKTDGPKQRHRHKPKQSKKAKKHKVSLASSSSDDDSEDDLDDSDSSSESSSSSEDEKEERRRARKRRAMKKRSQQRKKRKAKGVETDSDSDESESSESESDYAADEKRRRKRKKAKAKRTRDLSEEELTESEEDVREDGRVAKLQAQIAAMQLGNRNPRGRLGLGSASHAGLGGTGGKTAQKGRGKKRKSGKKGSTLEYKRVDQLWDSSIHNYKLTESAEDAVDVFDQYVFTVRRKFDWENKYKNTVVDIKSKMLREALQEVMKDVKGVSLVEDQPSVDPNMLFLYLEEIRIYTKNTLRAKVKTEKKRKIKKRTKLMIAHCKVLISYLDEDYAETKKTLYPMLEAGNITFDLLWALFKPNSIAYTSTYGSLEDPRCFKVDYATKECSFMRGEWYCIEGRYLEYDGKSFGLGDFEVDVEAFKGPRKITSLKTYPLTYHKDPESIKKQLVERGKRFVAMEGMNYRFHKGLAFMKKKKAVAKVNINGRVMIDPAIFRRINPNYPISLIKPKDPDELFSNDDNSDEDCSDCGCSDKSDDDAAGGEGSHLPTDEKDSKDRTKFKVIFDKEDKAHVVEVPVDEEGQELRVENIDTLPEGADPSQKRQFTEEELLIASPVVLGFAFSEKLWLEFSLSGVRDIEWNAGAFDSLVLPANQKTIVRALVESHKFHAAKTIDDVVQGKGRGLVAVLHGAPGTGKTLTAEGIAELLKCPLYMVSAGELGTDPRILEHELQKILDIAHSWGAVLLLDEADVFLEKRQVHDIHRNALVSIFLRLLEYFQGILFLTTNRVETFDDAFQSRIHVALRYGELTSKAKRSVWKMFLEKVQAMEGVEMDTFSDLDYDMLARRNLNGRQIKNCVRTSQALAVNEKVKLSMEHIKRVLEVAESFEQDLKGGPGFKEAMRGYT